MLARHLYLGPPWGKLHPGSPLIVVVVTRSARGQLRNKDCAHWALDIVWVVRTAWHGVRSGIDPINRQEKHSRRANVHLADSTTAADSSNSDGEPQATWIETRREYVRKFQELRTQIPRLLHPSRLPKLSEKPRDRESRLLQETVTGNISAPIGNAGRSLASDPLHNWTPDSSWWSEKTMDLDGQITTSLHWIYRKLPIGGQI